jgi:hypothetical protein
LGSKIVEVELPNGTVALVQAIEIDAEAGQAEKVGWKDTFDLEHVSGMLEGISHSIRSGLEKVRPTKTTVELGIDLALKNGKLTGLLVDGEAKASLRVTLEWGADSAEAPKPSE